MKNFNNQINRITPSEDSNQPPFPTILWLPNGFVNKEVIVAGMEVNHGLSTWTSRITCIQSLLKAQYSSSKDQHWSPTVALFSRDIIHLPSGRLPTLNHSHRRRRSILLLLEETYILDMDLPSLLIILLPKLPPWTWEIYLSTTMAFCVACFWAKNTLFNQRSAVVGRPCSWNSLVLPYYPHPEGGVFVEWWKGFLKIVLAPTKWQYLAELG